MHTAEFNEIEQLFQRTCVVLIGMVTKSIIARWYYCNDRVD